MGDEQRITRPAVERALAEFRTIGREAFLAKYGFGEAREYFVRDPVTGELADSKAIAGVAHGYTFPKIGALKPDQFSGGAQTVEARMKQLGFQMIRARSVWPDRELPPPFPSAPLYLASSELALPDAKIITDVAPKLQIASTALVARLNGHAEGVHDLTPRQFEELIGELLNGMSAGHVEITPYRRDGGKDLLAYVDVKIGRLLCLVEAKKYRRDRPVEVELVRSLYGVVAAEDASHGTLITTSYFSSGAKQFQSEREHRLSLRDYTHVAEWIRSYGKAKR